MIVCDSFSKILIENNHHILLTRPRYSWMETSIKGGNNMHFNTALSMTNVKKQYSADNFLSVIFPPFGRKDSPPKLLNADMTHSF